MPTSKRVPDVFTVTVNGTQIELPLSKAGVYVFPETREQFVTTLSRLLTIPGASGVKTTPGATVVAVEAGGMYFSVMVPSSMFKRVKVPSLTALVDAAVAEAVGLAVAS